jgi:hypothetical protein
MLRTQRGTVFTVIIGKPWLKALFSLSFSRIAWQYMSTTSAVHMRLQCGQLSFHLMPGGFLLQLTLLPAGLHAQATTRLEWLSWKFPGIDMKEERLWSVVAVFLFVIFIPDDRPAPASAGDVFCILVLSQHDASQ